MSGAGCRGAGTVLSLEPDGRMRLAFDGGEQAVEADLLRPA